MKNNVLKFIQSPNFDKNIGKNWYKNANFELKNLIHDHGLSHKISLNQVCLICSILSPANRWDKNIIDTKNVLLWFFKDSKKQDLPKCTTYKTNVKKAVNFLLELHEFKLANVHLNLYQTDQKFTADWVGKNMTALKTFNFYHNLKSPNFDGMYFTIDRHMLKILGIDKKAITKKQYTELQNVYFEAYKESKLDCLFHEFQAILWANYVFINKGILHY